MAHDQLGREQAGHTLDSVGLVGEAWLRLSASRDLRWASRPQFFAMAARAMRAVLVDHARARSTAKRGGGRVALTLDAARDAATEHSFEHLLAVDEALSRLAEIDSDACRAVECRYFAGLTLEETATALGLSLATLRRRWSFAKRWLRRELAGAA
jgi:RNA polymerase sigma factor (TIGR02999 family)